MIPDVVWLSNNRLGLALRDDGHFHEPPDLVIEVLSPGSANRKRDRVAKLQRYSRRGVDQYWTIDWRLRTVDVYRRESTALRLLATLHESDSLATPLLPGFSSVVRSLFDTVSP